MALVESLQKAIDYIENHLLDDITIKDIAEQICLLIISSGRFDSYGYDGWRIFAATSPNESCT